MRSIGTFLLLAGWLFSNGCGLSATVVGIALFVTKDDSTDTNEPPGGSITTPAALVNDVVRIRYTVFDAESDRVNVSVRYSRDGGATFESTPPTPATGLADYELPKGQASSPTGVSHVFLWNTFVDLFDGAGKADNVADVAFEVRLTQADGIPGPVLRTQPFTVWNRYTATVAGGESVTGVQGLVNPSGMARASNNDLFIADAAAHRVVRLDALSGSITVIAGTGAQGYNGDNIPATTAQLSTPTDVAVDAADNVYIADSGNSLIRRVDAATGFISTVAGNGGFGFAGDNGSPVLASLSGAEGIDVDASGNLWIADTGAHRIRFVNRTAAVESFTYWTTIPSPQQQVIQVQPNTIRTVAGGWIGLGEDINPLGALVSSPRRVRVIEINGIRQGFVIAETGLNRVRVVSLRGTVDSTSSTVFFGTTILNGYIRTVAGSLIYFGKVGTVGDNGPATSAKLSSPTGLDVLYDFLLLIADPGQNRVRLVGGGNIVTLAGKGAFGFAGDGGLPQLATLASPLDAKMDRSINIQIADTFNGRIRMTNTGFWSGAWGTSATDVWFVGGAGLATRYDGSGTFTPTFAGQPELLMDVDGSGSSDVVACSLEGNIYRWNGTQWNAETSGTTQPLFGVSALSSSSQWAVGALGTILHYNGTSWSPQSPAVATTTFADVFAASSTAVYAVGDAGRIEFYNGSWGSESGLPATASDLNGVWVDAGSGDVFVVGNGGLFWQKSSSTWTDRSAAGTTTEDLQAVWAASNTAVFAAGDKGTIAFWNGSTWTTQTTPVNDDLQAIWGTSSSDVYAAGIGDVILHYNGSTWSQLAPNSVLQYAGATVAAKTINSVTPPPARQTLAVIDPQDCVVDANGDLYFSNSGTNRVMHLDMTTRTITTVAGTGRAGYAGDGGAANGAAALTTADLRGVWVDTASNVWAVGTGGALLYYNGSAWSTQPSPVTTTLTAIHGTSASDIWAVGDAGRLLHYNGTNWSLQASGTTADLTGVFAPATGAVYVVGKAGTARYWNGTAWIDLSATASTAPVTDFTAVWATSGSNAFVVGGATFDPQQSAIWQWNGSALTTVTPPATSAYGLRALWGANGSNIWAAGDAGIIYYYNGSGWAVQSASLSFDLHTVFGRTTTDLFAGGDSGAFWAYGSPNWTSGTGNNDTIAESVGLRAGIAFGTVAYVVGDDGTIYRQASAGAAWTLQHGLAQLNSPGGLALNPAGTVLYVADTANNRVRAVNLTGSPITLFSTGTAIVLPAGGIATIAGGGSVAVFPHGDNGVATAAELVQPTAVTVDAATGDIYISDTGHHRVRVVAATGATAGDITNFAGTSGLPGFSGDTGAATSAKLNTPVGTGFDGSGNFYIADAGNQRIRVVDTGGTINTFAGNGTQGFSSDGQAPTATAFDTPLAIMVVGSDFYVSDAGNVRIRKISGSPAVVTTIAGSGAGGFGGDPKPPVNAQLNVPIGLAYDPATDTIYWADSGNGRVRRFGP